MSTDRIIKLELPFGSHPYEVQMLKEIYNLSLRDYDVLKLCADGPLCRWQCNKSMLASAKYLESWGLVSWVSHKQRWEIDGSAHHLLASISHLIHAYTPPRKSKAKVLPFSKAYAAAIDRMEHNGGTAS
jgi:hypothetical protein